MVHISRINGGKAVGLAVCEVTAIPYYELLHKELDRACHLNQVLFVQLITGFYRRSPANQASLEILWQSIPVKNQTYAAQVRQYVLLRQMGTSALELQSALEETQQNLVNELEGKNFSLRVLEEEDLASFSNQLESVDSSAVLAISRKERYAQHVLMPNSCLYYNDLVRPSEDLNIADLTNMLTQRPNSAVSLQLIPTVYTAEEIMGIEESRRYMSMYISNMRFCQGIQADANIQAIADAYDSLLASEKEPLFYYNFLIYAQPNSALSIANKVIDAIGEEGSAAGSAFETVDLTGCGLAPHKKLEQQPWAISNLLVFQQRDRVFWDLPIAPLYFLRLKYLMTARELSGIFKLPIDDGHTIGLESKKLSSNREKLNQSIISEGNFKLGRILNASRTQEGDAAHAGVPLNDFTKHGLIVGMPGSGKTNFSLGMLLQFWRDFQIPFLAIEPTKSEYRSLLDAIDELQVFTPGKNFISPFVMNPFVPPENVRLETYKSTLKTAFEAAVSMATPLDLIFEETINNCYSDFKWLDSYTTDDRGEIFNISDFIRCFKKTFEDIGYTGDARNIGRAGLVRLRSLVNLFDQYSTIPVKDLLNKPTVIELAALENSDQKALIIALVLLSVLSYVNTNYMGTGDLRNVILLEEAHVLLDSGSTSGAEGAEPRAIAQGLIKRILAEMRSYGVGMIVADQSPRKVTSDIVALTDMKMVFRLVEKTDKQMIADSTNMDETKMQRLSRLKPGEAFLFFQKLEEPEEIVVPDYRAEHQIDITISDEKLHELSGYWSGKEDMLRPYPQCGTGKYCKHTCDYSRRLLAREIARRIFVKYFKSEMKEFDPVLKVFGRITREVMEELNGEEFSEELLYCVKLHLWRKIRYDTEIPVRDIQIINSLKK